MSDAEHSPPAKLLANTVARKTAAVKLAGLVVLLAAAALALPTSHAAAQIHGDPEANPSPDPSLPSITCPAPVISDPKPTLASSTLGPDIDEKWSIPVNLSWSATSPCGISSFRLEQRTVGGAWSQIPGVSSERDPTDPTRQHGGIALSLQAPTGIPCLGCPYAAYQFRVMAVDALGNGSAWAQSGSVVAYDNDNPTIEYFGDFLPTFEPVLPPAPPPGIPLDRPFGGGTTLLCPNPPRGAARLWIPMRYIAWIGTAGPAGADARISVDGALVGTYSSRMATTSKRRVLFTKRFAQGGYHKVMIQSIGGNGGLCEVGPNVAIDAFIVEVG
jgi:hypothetical protein